MSGEWMKDLPETFEPEGSYLFFADGSCYWVDHGTELYYWGS